MKKLFFLFILLSAAALSFSIDIVVDANTGYMNSFQENFNEIYKDIFYEGSPEHSPLNQKTLDLIKTLEQQTLTIEDEMFNYSQVITFCINKVKNDELVLQSYSSDKTVNIATFVSPYHNPYFKVPTILIDEDYFVNDHISVFISSIMREMKAAADFFIRIDNDWYTEWDELENIMYRLDSLYFQSRFIEDFFITNEFYVTNFEGFMLSNYKDEYLRSFIFFYYGIDRDTLLRGYSTLNQLRQGDISIKNFIEGLSGMTGTRLFDEVKDFKSEGAREQLAAQFTYTAFYKYILNHYAVRKGISEETYDDYNSLLFLVDELMERNIIYIPEFQNFVKSYQSNLTPLSTNP